MNEYLQQGDVLIFKEPIPETAIEDIRDPVIMHGESGHKHKLEDEGFGVIQSPKTKKYEIKRDPKSNIIYLKIFHPTDLVHEEHKTITLPPGDYRIGQVREKGFFSDMIAPVVD